MELKFCYLGGGRYRWYATINEKTYTHDDYVLMSEGFPCLNDGTPEHDNIMKDWILKTWHKKEHV